MNLYDQHRIALAALREIIGRDEALDRAEEVPTGEDFKEAVEIAEAAIRDIEARS